MASPAPAPADETCHLSELMLPKNDANTCWWLSANLALFHKQRPEIGRPKNPPSTEKQQMFDLISSNYSRLAEYYSTGKGQTYTMNDLLEQRKSEIMKGIFNTESFKVDGNGMQSPDEYITLLSPLIGFDRGLIAINTGNAVSAYETSAYDIYLHAKYFGTTIGKSNIEVAQISSDVNTLILTFARVTNDPENPNTPKKTSIPVSPLKRITLPTFAPATQSNLLQDPYTADDLTQNTVTSSFFLDAMIVYEPDHYVAYVKCDTSDRWFYYKAIQEGNLGDTSKGNKEFATFEEMMDLDGNKITENCTHLFYTKEGGEGPEQAVEGPVPVEAPVEAPAEAPAEVPAEVPAEAPVEAPAEAPAEAPVEAPAEVPAEAPVEGPAEVPAEAPADPGAQRVAAAKAEAERLARERAEAVAKKAKRGTRRRTAGLIPSQENEKETLARPKRQRPA
jgi:hypothetical protein